MNNEERQKLKAKEFEEYVANTGEYILMSQYINVNTHVSIKHLECGHEYSVRPSHFKTRGQRCKQCTRKKDREKAKQKLLKLMGTEYTLNSEYRNNKTKVKVIHNKCGHEYEVKPDNFFHGKRCPKCKISTGERICVEYFEKNNIEYVPQYKIPECKNVRALPFDFAIFLNDELYCLVEYQGIQHYTPSNLFGEDSFQKTQKNDAIKREYCFRNGILLIEIPYWVNNIDEFLASKLEINI